MKDSPVRGTELPCTTNKPHEFFFLFFSFHGFNIAVKETDTQIENNVKFLEHSADCDCLSIILFQGVLFCCCIKTKKHQHFYGKRYVFPFAVTLQA